MTFSAIITTLIVLAYVSQASGLVGQFIALHRVDLKMMSRCYRWNISSMVVSLVLVGIKLLVENHS